MKLVTDYPIALDSPDHLWPEGTKQDNHTCAPLLDELEFRFGRGYSLLDLGCAGGQFVRDAHVRGAVAIGLEGSDYSIHHARANWPQYHNDILFTCDISRSFTLLKDDGGVFFFDVITAWEVFEHIPPERLDCLCCNIASHLSARGVAFATINQDRYLKDGHDLHLSAHLKWEEWSAILEKYFLVAPYPYLWSVRDDTRKSSYFVELRNK